MQGPSCALVDTALVDDVRLPGSKHRIWRQCAIAVQQCPRRQQGELGVIRAPGIVVQVGDDPITLPVLIVSAQVSQRISGRQPNQASYGLVVALVSVPGEFCPGDHSPLPFMF